MTRIRSWAAAMLLVGFTLTTGLAASQEPHHAIPARLAAQALVLDIVQAGDRLVAVGDRGHVLHSSDAREWLQAEVPVQAVLTAVTLSDGRLWAVGHDAAIIHSADGGQTWELQHYEPELEQPLLDVHFINANEGLAIGAYGLMMRTRDGGQTWETDYMADLLVSEAIDWQELAGSDTAFDDELFGDTLFEGDGVDEDDYYDAAQDFDRGCYEFMECHLNALADLGAGRLVIAAERGYGFRSTDGGENWESFRFAYSGSMFGIVTHGECMTAFGLRGHAQQSCDFGTTWTLLETGTQSSLMGAAVLDDGHIVMVGANGDMVEVTRSGEIRQRANSHGGDLAMVVAGPDGLIVVGEGGIRSGQ